MSVQFSSVAQSCPTLCDPMNRSTPGIPVHHQLPDFTQTHVHRSVTPSSHLILCRPLLLLPPIPPSIRVFSNESTLRIRWPKHWSFSFSISPLKVKVKMKVKSLSCVRLFVTRGLQPTKLLRPRDSPGKSTAVGCHFLLHGIFLTQGSNPSLPHCRQTL